MFTLHPQLEKESVPVATLRLCNVRLMADCNFPWLILVPERENVREVHRLSEADQQLLMQEIAFVAERFEALTKADKMNVAALGNMVSQLHVHIIARYKGDPAWPGPIWGVVPAKEYGEEAHTALVGKLQAAFGT